MDNAECHMNIHAIEFAIQNGIVIVTLPPHTTAKLQPLDVSIFGPFKSHLRALQRDFHLTNPNKPLTEHQLPELACKAWVKACTPANVMSGFAATGIWPIDSNIFPDDAFLGAEVTEQPPPETVAEEQELSLELDGSLPPSPTPSPLPSSNSNEAAEIPTPEALDSSSPCPSGSPMPGPSGEPTPGPSGSATPGPSGAPTPGPSGSPTPGPSGSATPGPSGSPTPSPSGSATHGPSGFSFYGPSGISPPVSSDSITLRVEAVRPFPKADPRPLGKGRKRVKSCILTENEGAISDMRSKEEKKRKAEEKKLGRPKTKKAAPKPKKKSKPEEEESEEETPVVYDDDSEYSDEMDDILDTALPYPFQDKEPEVRN